MPGTNTDIDPDDLKTITEAMRQMKLILLDALTNNRGYPVRAVGIRVAHNPSAKGKKLGQIRRILEDEPS